MVNGTNLNGKILKLLKLTNIHGRHTYTGEYQERIYKDKEVVSCVHEKGCINKPLTEEQKASNKERSRVRVRGEHLFGFVENSRNGSFVSTIGVARAKAKIGMNHTVK